MSITMLAALAAPFGLAIAQTPASDKPHKAIFQVSDANPAKWNLALNNAKNVQKDLGKANVAVEIVAYGPVIGMLQMESVTGTRIAEAIDTGVEVVACENTMRNKKLSRDDMLPKIGYVGAGVVELMKRQEEGYTYIRP